MTKSQLCVKQIRLPSIISVLTNNKKELWKTVSLTSFQKPPNASRFNLLVQVYPSVLPSVFAVIYKSFFFMFWVVILMFQSIWWQFPLFEFVTQLIWEFLNVKLPVHTARIRLCLKMEIFSPLVWPIVHPCPVKTVIENASFIIFGTL